MRAFPLVWNVITIPLGLAVFVATYVEGFVVLGGWTDAHDVSMAWSAPELVLAAAGLALLIGGCLAMVRDACRLSSASVGQTGGAERPVARRRLRAGWKVGMIAGAVIVALIVAFTSLSSLLIIAACVVVTVVGVRRTIRATANRPEGVPLPTEGRFGSAWAVITVLLGVVVVVATSAQRVLLSNWFSAHPRLTDTISIVPYVSLWALGAVLIIGGGIAAGLNYTSRGPRLPQPSMPSASMPRG